MKPRRGKLRVKTSDEFKLCHGLIGAAHSERQSAKPKVCVKIGGLQFKDAPILFFGFL